MVIRLLLVLVLSLNLAYGTNKIRQYARSLEKLSTEQYITLVLAYRKGAELGMGLLLTAIVWKESSFGIRTVNTRDGKNGSFGIAQILLDTAVKRNNVKTKEERERLKFRLLTNPDFNLDQALKELMFWKEFYKKKKIKQWRLYTVASYNAGRKSYDSPLGQKYANDIAIRIEALKVFLNRDEFNVDMTMDGELYRVAAEVFNKPLR